MSQIITLELTSARAFGRNGGFNPAQIELWADHPGRLVIDVFSARRGDSPPLCLKIERSELPAILAAAAKAETDDTPTSVRLEHPAPARGRNNGFNATELYFHVMPTLNTVEMSAYSQRRGDQAPWRLYLSGADMRRLLSELDKLAAGA